MNYQVTYDSPIGQLTIVSDGNAITGLWMEQQKYYPEKRKAADGRNLPEMKQTVAWLDAYFSGSRALPPLPPLAPRGTDFQRNVWNALLAIPYAQRATYGQLAKVVGCASARAVGSAVGRNPISILIPCHRVVPADGSVGGFAGGQDRKIWLLNHETQ